MHEIFHGPSHDVFALAKLLSATANGMALVVAKGITEFPSREKLRGHIDVYWIVQDGGLCILMAFLLKQNKVRGTTMDISWT